jgi:predicted component of type VI protein secretion system
VPVVNIGRADYNDLVIPDDSVSGSHAKLQRREGVWILVDNDSTNGTWVDGERVVGEMALGPGTVVRFGEVSVMFEPTDDHLGTDAGSGTKVMGAMKFPTGPTPTPSAPPQAAPPAPPAPSAPPTAPAPAPVAAHAPVPPPRSKPGAAEPMASTAPRRPAVVTGPGPSKRPPAWLIPAVLIILLGVVAAILLSR